MHRPHSIKIAGARPTFGKQCSDPTCKSIDLTVWPLLWVIIDALFYMRMHKCLGTNVSARACFRLDAHNENREQAQA